MKSEVKLSNVTKSFRKERVLRGITHSFEQGKIHGIMGFNGSGKTVMFKCICGFLRPDSGAVIVQGRRIGKDGDFPQSVGMIIESPGFLPHVSGFANLKRLAAIRNRVTDEQIRESMARVGLDPFSKKKVGQYSLGMRERLGIAGAQDVCDLLDELRDRGRTILIAAHNMMEIEYLCDTICEMDAGVLTQVK